MLGEPRTMRLDPVLWCGDVPECGEFLKSQSRTYLCIASRPPYRGKAKAVLTIVRIDPDEAIGGKVHEFFWVSRKKR